MISTRCRIYATVSIVGIGGYVAVQARGMVQDWAALLGMAVVASLRLAAIIWGLMLPIFSLSDDGPGDL